MTLRDYFAAKTAAGDADADPWVERPTTAALIARAEVYYALADAMLMVRDR